MSEALVLVESVTFVEDDDGWRVEATVIDGRNRQLRIRSLSGADVRTIKAAMDHEESRFGPVLTGANALSSSRLPVSCYLPWETLESAEPVAA